MKKWNAPKVEELDVKNTECFIWDWICWPSCPKPSKPTKPAPKPPVKPNPNPIPTPIPTPTPGIDEPPVEDFISGAMM